MDERIRRARCFILEYLVRGELRRDFYDACESLKGLTGAATAEVISNCVNILGEDLVYLEVGIFQACNLSMVANANPNVKCVGVDNFSQVFKENDYYSQSTEELVKERLTKYGHNNASYVKSDFRDFFKSAMPFEQKVGVYFFDGPHELQDQIDGVEMALPYLADRALIFIDDLASPNVQKSYVSLIRDHKELTPIAFLSLDGNDPRAFNQGQVVLEYNRG